VAPPRALLASLAIDQHQQARAAAANAWKIEKRSVRRHAEVDRARIVGRVAHAFNQAHRPARLEAAEIEGRRQQPTVQAVDQVPRRHVTPVATSGDDDSPFSRSQRVHNNAAVVPGGKSFRTQRKEHPLAARQELRTMGLIAFTDRDQVLGSPTRRWYREDPFESLAV
jgi:hypothetical protein